MRALKNIKTIVFRNHKGCGYYGLSVFQMPLLAISLGIKNCMPLLIPKSLTATTCCIIQIFPENFRHSQIILYAAAARHHQHGFRQQQNLN